MSFAHSPYYPSYNVLVEPDRHAARLVYASAGHHRLAGAVDLDGDGHRELLLWGINNRIGWASGIAAVRVPPAQASQAAESSEASMALAPDLYMGSYGNASLLWYELLPPPLIFPKNSRFEVDPVRRRLLLGREIGGPLELGFDGFLEIGMVSRKIADLFKYAYPSGGPGVLLIWDRFIVFRVEAGFSREGGAVYLQSEHAF